MFFEKLCIFCLIFVLQHYLTFIIIQNNVKINLSHPSFKQHVYPTTTRVNPMTLLHEKRVKRKFCGILD
jgi:hypothetical protein